MRKVLIPLGDGCSLRTFLVGALILFFSSVAAWAAGSQLVSARNSGVPQPVPGNGSSSGPIVSTNGRYVVFVSTASDLVTNDNGLLYSDVFFRDRQSNTTTLVTGNLSGTGGGNGNSIADAISADGRYILFESDASDLVAGGGTNAINNIYVRDLVLGTTTLVSAATNGVPGSGASTKPYMTPDGRYVTFVSSATNLVANDANGFADVFVRDLLLGTTTLVSVGATTTGAGIIDTPVITPDGRFVAYVSSARGMTPPFSSGHTTEIYVRDRQGNNTVWISTNSTGPAQVPNHPRISDDGRYVFFKQGIGGGVPQASFIYRYDSVTGSNTLVNTLSISTQDGLTVASFVDDIFGPEITADGHFLYYSPGNIIVKWNGQTATGAAVGLDAAGAIPTNSTISGAPLYTQDGHYLAFLCNATNMVTNAISGGYHLYLRDMQVGTNYLVDIDTNGVGSSDLAGTAPSMTPDGRYIAFAAQDGNLVPGDKNLSLDVFLRDMSNGTTELISSRYATNQTGSGTSSISQTAMTPDGHWLVFSSRADDLVTNDFNNEQDVFVRDLWTGSNILVSVGTSGVTPLGGPSGSPAITPNGRYVVFTSVATNLYPGDTNRAADLLIRDLQSGITTLAYSNNSGGALGNGDVSSPSISADGRYVTFLCRTNNLTTVPMWLDVVSNGLVVLTNANSTVAPSMSANGRFVAFANNTAQLFVRDMQTGLNIFNGPSNVTSVAMSPGGNRLLFTVGIFTLVTDIPSGSNLLNQARPRSIVSQAQWSVDDRFVAFVVSTAITAGDNNSTNDVFLCDLQTSNLTLVSINASHTGAGNAASDSPAVSGNGRFVVFSSLATDIVSGVTNSPSIYKFDRYTGSNTVIGLGESAMPGWGTWMSRPTVSSDGKVVAFQSLKPNHVSGVVDLNRVQDIFSQLQTIPPFVDSDADGIADAWLNQFFGHPTGQAGDLSRAQDDADGDGMSNLQEFLTGTNPTNNASVFRLQLTPVANSTNVILMWPAESGKTYKISFKTLLSDPNWTDLGTNIVASGPQASFTVPTSATNHFYRVISVN